MLVVRFEDKHKNARRRQFDIQNRRVMVKMHRGVLRSLLSQLVVHERITTTLPRAIEVRRIMDRLITMAKEDTLCGRKKIHSEVSSDAARLKLYSGLAHRYSDIKGGYTRVTRGKVRAGDGAQLALIELSNPGNH